MKSSFLTEMGRYCRFLRKKILFERVSNSYVPDNSLSSLFFEKVEKRFNMMKVTGETGRFFFINNDVFKWKTDKFALAILEDFEKGELQPNHILSIKILSVLVNNFIHSLHPKNIEMAFAISRHMYEADIISFMDSKSLGYWLNYCFCMKFKSSPPFFRDPFPMDFVRGLIMKNLRNSEIDWQCLNKIMNIFREGVYEEEDWELLRESQAIVMETILNNPERLKTIEIFNFLILNNEMIAEAQFSNEQINQIFENLAMRIQNDEHFFNFYSTALSLLVILRKSPIKPDCMLRILDLLYKKCLSLFRNGNKVFPLGLLDEFNYFNVNLTEFIQGHLNTPRRASGLGATIFMIALMKQQMNYIRGTPLEKQYENLNDLVKGKLSEKILVKESPYFVFFHNKEIFEEIVQKSIVNIKEGANKYYLTQFFSRYFVISQFQLPFKSSVYVQNHRKVIMHNLKPEEVRAMLETCSMKNLIHSPENIKLVLEFTLKSAIKQRDPSSFPLDEFENFLFNQKTVRFVLNDSRLAAYTFKSLLVLLNKLHSLPNVTERFIYYAFLTSSFPNQTPEATQLVSKAFQILRNSGKLRSFEPLYHLKVIEYLICPPQTLSLHFEDPNQVLESLLIIEDQIQKPWVPEMHIVLQSFLKSQASHPNADALSAVTIPEKLRASVRREIAFLTEETLQGSLNSFEFLTKNAIVLGYPEAILGEFEIGVKAITEKLQDVHLKNNQEVKAFNQVFAVFLEGHQDALQSENERNASKDKPQSMSSKILQSLFVTMGQNIEIFSGIQAVHIISKMTTKMVFDFSILREALRNTGTNYYSLPFASLSLLLQSFNDASIKQASITLAILQKAFSEAPFFRFAIGDIMKTINNVGIYYEDFTKEIIDFLPQSEEEDLPKAILDEFFFYFLMENSLEGLSLLLKSPKLNEKLKEIENPKVLAALLAFIEKNKEETASFVGEFRSKAKVLHQDPNALIPKEPKDNSELIQILKGLGHDVIENHLVRNPGGDLAFVADLFIPKEYFSHSMVSHSRFLI